MDHARSHTQAVLVRFLPEEREFIAEAVEAKNSRRSPTDGTVKAAAFVRGSAIENAERELGRKFVPPPNGAPARKTSTRKKGKAK